MTNVWSPVTRELAKGSVFDGWHDLIDTLFDAKPPYVTIEQLKEKCGGLRVYWTTVADGDTEAWQEAVGTAKLRAWQTCELCGARGTLGQMAEGYMRTLCAAHQDEEDAKGAEEGFE